MSIKDNLEKIEERIEKACTRSGRKREEVTLMGVAKFQPVGAVEEAVNAGLRCFGESRVQEAVLKYKGFKEKYPDTELHFIGPLQRNKAKQAAFLFDCVQSLDRESLATELAKHVAAGPLASCPLPVLLEFRTGEDTKSGFTNLDDLCRAVDLVFTFPSLSVRGLMTIAPAIGAGAGTDDTAAGAGTDEDILRPAFRRMVELRREMERRYPGTWSCLSMGMSNDFEIAIEEGSTMVRIGTAIFGKGV